jgi:hypothetical protein
MLPESVDPQHIAALRIFNHRRKGIFNTIGLTGTSRPGRGMSVLIPGSGQSSGHLGWVPAWANECHLSQLLARFCMEGSCTETPRRVCCIVHPFCFSCALFPSELLERSSKRSAPLAKSCPVLLSFFASSLAVASRKPSAARSPAFDDFRSLFIRCSFPDKHPSPRILPCLSQ